MLYTLLYQLAVAIQRQPETVILWSIFAVLVIMAVGLGLFYWKLKNSMENRLRSILYHDSVTGKDNLLKFKEKFTEILNAKYSRKENYCIVYVRVNRFATLFHKSDERCKEALRVIANAWQSLLGEEEFFARIDEECFVALKKYDYVVEITDFLQTLNEKLNEDFSLGGTELALLLKCGVYTIDSKSAKMLLPETMIEYARSAAMSIRTTRESETVFFNDLLAQNIVMERDIENMMVPALKNHEFELYLQPKFDIVSNQMVGAEALVRWQSVKGFLMPDSFIPIFEKNGFVRRLDMYMFEEVCSLLSKWIHTGQPVVPISINLSRAHLNNTNFINELQEIMHRYSIPYDLIELELTESAIMDEDIDIVKVMNALKKAGFRLSMDDFGSGYSSLNMLRRIPVDVVKIDKGFLGRKDIDSKGRIVVKNIVSMVKELGLDIICEGVETNEQADFLRTVGCDHVQGYLYSKPITVSSFEALGNATGV